MRRARCPPYKWLKIAKKWYLWFADELFNNAKYCNSVRCGLVEDSR
jgi:4-alpha-glucanotransferase